MAHPKDKDVYPIDTIVRLKKTGEFARITGHGWLRPERKEFFLHYYAEIEGRKGTTWCLAHHDELVLECLPA